MDVSSEALLMQELDTCNDSLSSGLYLRAANVAKELRDKRLAEKDLQEKLVRARADVVASLHEQHRLQDEYNARLDQVNALMRVTLRDARMCKQLMKKDKHRRNVIDRICNTTLLRSGRVLRIGKAARPARA